MATEIRVPSLGESVTEATVGKWFKKVGEQVAIDEPLVEIETEKVTLEVPSPVGGVIEAIAAADGATIGPGGLLGTISGGNGAVKAPTPSIATTVPKPAPKVAPPSPSLSPSVRKIVAENNLSPDSLSGSGKNGRPTKADAIAAVAAVNKSPAPPASVPAVRPPPAAPVRAPAPEQSAGEERVPMSRLRQTIARRLKDAQNNAAILTTFNEVDMSAVTALRNRYKEAFEKKHGVKLGFMSFFVKAVVAALREVPAVNGEIDATDIVYKHYCHIGVAFGTERGLVVPVLRDADRMGLAEIERAIAALGAKAREGTLGIDDMQGGTFTISNGGVYGSLLSTPILNAPQSGILGMHKIEERPVVIGGAVVARPMMYLALSYDHRIVDGREAVTFLVRVKEGVEAPERLMLDL